MIRRLFAYLTLGLLTVHCGGGSSSKKSPEPESCSQGETRSGMGLCLPPVQGNRCELGTVFNPITLQCLPVAGCPLGQEINEEGFCEAKDAPKVCQRGQEFNPILGRCVAKIDDKSCPAGQTKNDAGVCVPQKTLEPKVDFVWNFFEDIAADDDVYKIGYLKLSGLQSGDEVVAHTITKEGDTCHATLLWTGVATNSLQISSHVNQEQSCLVTVEVTTKSQKVLKTRTFTVRLKKRQLAVTWDPSNAALAFGGPRAYLGSFRVQSNSQFAIDRKIVRFSDNCVVELDGNNLYGRYTGPDEASTCGVSVDFKTPDGRLAESKQVEIVVQKAQLSLSLLTRQPVPEVPFGSSYWNVASTLVTTNMDEGQYELDLVNDPNVSTNSAICGRLKSSFQFNQLAMNLELNSGESPGEVVCRYLVKVASKVNPALLDRKPIAVKLRKARTGFKIENMAGTIFNGKDFRNIASIVLETEVGGVSVQNIRATSDACSFLTFKTLPGSANSLSQALTLQTSSLAPITTPEQKCEVSVALTLTNGAVLAPKNFVLQIIKPILQLELSARELSMWASDDKKILDVRLTFNPGAYDITNFQGVVFEKDNNVLCQEALGLTSPALINRKIALASRATQDLSCNYSLRADLPQNYFVSAEAPFVINFVKRPVPSPTQVNYRLQVQTLTQTVISDQKSVSFAQLTVLDEDDRAVSLSSRQVNVKFDAGCEAFLAPVVFDEASQTVLVKTKQPVSQKMNCSAVFKTWGYDAHRDQEVLTSKAYAFTIVPQPTPKTAIYTCKSLSSEYAAQVWFDLESKSVSSAYISYAQPDDTGMNPIIGLVMELQKNEATSTSQVTRFDVCKPGVTFSCPNSIARELKPSVVIDRNEITIEAFANFDIRLLPPMSWRSSECSVFTM